MPQVALSRRIALGLALSALACRSGRSPAPDASGSTSARQDVSPEPVTPSTPKERVELAAQLMLGFADRTGVSSKQATQRYLWTDAFAVTNFLGLERETGEARYRELALTLVDRVHHTLGRHRGDDGRSGWLSGLDGQKAEQHPTRGGLRIGKPLPERKPDEPFDDRAEWDRDGQYFHYLTRWMHALDQVTRATKKTVFNGWARELAETAHRAFVNPRTGRMYWKLSIDLSRPLVSSMGQHDPLDGYVTCCVLRSIGSGPALATETESFRKMVDASGLRTADPLGLGGVLIDAHRVDQLMRRGASVDGELRDRLLRAALTGLDEYAAGGDLDGSAAQRLAFRELGLAIGLSAVAMMKKAGQSALLERVIGHDGLRSRIVSFWMKPGNRQAASWIAHRDINDVMLATALAPDGYLALSWPELSAP